MLSVWQYFAVAAHTPRGAPSIVGSAAQWRETDAAKETTRHPALRDLRGPHTERRALRTARPEKRTVNSP